MVRVHPGVNRLTTSHLACRAAGLIGHKDIKQRTAGGKVRVCEERNCKGDEKEKREAKKRWKINSKSSEGRDKFILLFPHLHELP